MRKIKMMGLAAIAATSLMASAGVSAASAAIWDPPGVNETGNLFSATSVLTDSSNHHVFCSTSSTTLTASGSVAMAITTTNPVSFTNCGNDIIGGATSVSTAGTWSFHADSTTTVTATASTPGKPIATIQLAGGICTITVDGPVVIPKNTWTNASHQLHLNDSVTFPLTQSGGCFGAVGANGRLSGTYTLPSAVVIT